MTRRAQTDTMRVSQSDPRDPGEGREWRRWHPVVKNNRIIRDDLVDIFEDKDIKGEGLPGYEQWLELAHKSYERGKRFLSVKYNAAGGMSWSFVDESEVEILEDEPISACCSVSLDEFLTALDYKPQRM